MAFRRMPRLTAGHLVDKATVTRLPLALAKGSPFDSVFAPRTNKQANGRPALAALIEGTIPLPSLLRLRGRAFLGQLYRRRRLLAREIARPTGVSRSGVLGSDAQGDDAIRGITLLRRTSPYVMQQQG